VKKIDEKVPDTLNQIADKVLNYRPKDRQPKPPKKAKPKKKKTS
jgi:hypothetical protein